MLHLLELSGSSKQNHQLYLQLQMGNNKQDKNVSSPERNELHAIILHAQKSTTYRTVKFWSAIREHPTTVQKFI